MPSRKHYNLAFGQPLLPYLSAFLAATHSLKLAEGIEQIANAKMKLAAVKGAE